MPTSKSCCASGYSCIPPATHTFTQPPTVRRGSDALPQRGHSFTTWSNSSSSVQCLVTGLCSVFLSQSPPLSQFSQGSILVRPRSTCFSIFSASVHIFFSIIVFPSFPPCLSLFLSVPPLLLPASFVLIKETSSYI